MLIPYVDTTLYPLIDLSTVPHSNSVHLGFVIADSDQDPSWGGYHKVSSDFMDKRIAGQELICSFGGAYGKELAQVCTNEKELFEKYKTVIDRYDFIALDFDIEGQALTDSRSNYIRQKAIQMIRKEYPKLGINLTCPSMPFGLTKSVLLMAPDFDIINIMAMNFGDVKEMGSAVCEAATMAHKQTHKPIGITVMIGVNDTGEIFTLEDAKLLQVFAKKNAWVAFKSFWSIHRDRGEKGDLAQWNQVTSNPWAFSKLLK
jgi:chitinase